MNSTIQRTLQWLKWLGILFLVAFGLLAVNAPWLAEKRQEKARKAWKERMILEIDRLANDRTWIAEEAAHIASKQPGTPDRRILAEGWMSDELILLRTGEWLIYRSYHNNKDIFLAKGSNGKWYYSTCHFCSNMCAITIDDVPFDLDTFIKRYQLREFDGVSDECLVAKRSYVDYDIEDPVDVPTDLSRFELNLTGDDTKDMRVLKKLRMISSLPLLEITGKEISPAILKTLERFENIDELLISSSACQDGDVPSLLRLKKLTKLELGGTGITDRGLQHLESSSRLKWVSLKNTAVSGGGLQYLAKLPLKSLSIEGATISAEGMRYIGQFTNLISIRMHLKRLPECGLSPLATLSQLETVVIESASVGDEDLAALKSNTKLYYLVLRDCQVTDKGLGYLAGLKKMQLICIACSEITDEGLKHLQNLPELQTLHLNKTSITGAGLQYLANLKKLFYLDLSGGKLTGHGFSHFSANKELVWLDLQNNPIIDDGMAEIALVPNLRSLDLRNTQITDKGLEYLHNKTSDQFTLKLTRGQIDQRAQTLLKQNRDGVTILQGSPGSNSLSNR